MADSQTRSTVSFTNPEASLIMTLLEGKIADQRTDPLVRILAEKALIKINKRLGTKPAPKRRKK